MPTSSVVISSTVGSAGPLPSDDASESASVDASEIERELNDVIESSKAPAIAVGLQEQALDASSSDDDLPPKYQQTISKDFKLQKKDGGSLKQIHQKTPSSSGPGTFFAVREPIQVFSPHFVQVLSLKRSLRPKGEAQPNIQNYLKNLGPSGERANSRSSRESSTIRTQPRRRLRRALSSKMTPSLTDDRRIVFSFFIICFNSLSY